MATDHESGLEERTKRLDGCVRRRNSLEYLGCAVIAVIFGLQGLGVFGPSGTGVGATLIRFGAALVATGAIVVAVEIHRRMAPIREIGRSPGRLSTCLAALERQRRALKSAWLWYTGPLIPGFLVIYAGQAAKPNVGFVWPLVAAVITVAVLAGIAAMNRRAADGIGEEIERLEEMARRSS